MKILGFQFNISLDCDYKDEYLIKNENFYKQFKEAKEIISDKNADIIIFPEMCYLTEEDSYYKEISKGQLVIAGSYYENGLNKTIVFQDEKKYAILKCNASGAEPMIRNHTNIDTATFMKEHLKNHTFYVKDKKIIVLNCMEYYAHAYRIAREIKDVFAIICICSNSNQKVFKEESMALHNHQENVYSFVVNAVSNYMGKPYAKGESYGFGPIQYHEQDWLRKEGVLIDNHNAAIFKLGSDAAYFYGEFESILSRFGRSDAYTNNPKNFEIKKLGKENVMKKNIIITAGPTNERMDAVMQITNMSTGALGATVAEEFLKTKGEEIESLYYLSPKLAKKPQIESDKLKLIQIDTAESLLNKLKEILTSTKIDAVIHSAAVGDYTGEYAITAPLLAEEIAKNIYKKNLSKAELEKLILSIIRNPKDVVSDEHKISSYEKDLMFKLTLTIKVISEIKKLAPDTRLFGFKLLDGVPYEELIRVAAKLREKNKAEYIIANDLSNIGHGAHKAYFVGENGVDYTCENKKDIALTLKRIIFDKK